LRKQKIFLDFRCWDWFSIRINYNFSFWD